MNGKTGIYDKILDLASRIGPLCGGIAGVCYTVSYVIYFIKDRDLSNLAQAAFGIGFASISVGLGRAVKKNTDIMVASEAEKRLDPQHPMSAASDIPQIQAEINKQKQGVSETATDGKTKE